MNIKNLLMKFWPVVFIFLLWFIFASPYFIKGKVPYASTYQVNFFSPWSAYPELAGPVKNNAMPDVISQIYPWKHFTIQSLANLEVPLWNPYSFSGTNHLANYQSAVFSPFNAFYFLLPFIDAWSLIVLLQPLLAGIFMFLLARSFKFSEPSSFISSISFMFCGFIVTWMGYATLGYAILFLPLSLYAIEEYFVKKRIKYLILLSVTVPLSFFSGHFQISLYFLSVVVFYLIYKLISTKDFKTFTHSFLFLIFGMMLSASQIFPSIEVYLQSFRSAVFHQSEIVPWGYLPTFLAPDFFGNPVTRNDWFGHYAEWNAYIGLIPLMLAFYSLLNVKNTRVIYFFIIGFVAILLSFFTPLLDLVAMLHIPVLSTSAASRIIVVFSFSFAILAGFGFDNLLKDIQVGNKKKIWVWLLSFSAIFLILWVVILLKIFMPLEKIIIARQNLILPSILFIATFSIIIIATFFKNLKKPIGIFSLLTIVLILILGFDMWRFATKWQVFESKNLVFKELPITKYFSNLSGYNRVFSNLGSEVCVYYNLSCLEGYDAVYIKRYGEFISTFSKEEIGGLERSIVSVSRNGAYTPKAINLLGVKYVVHRVSDDHAVWAFPFWSYPIDAFRQIYKDDKFEVYENDKAFPRVFLAGDYSVIQDGQKIIDLMFSENFDLRKSLVLEKDPKIQKTQQVVGSASIRKYTNNSVLIDVNTKQESLLFLSDVFYPGWRAFIDKKEVPVYRADYIFRAVVVPTGKHEVKFMFYPTSFKAGIFTTIGGLVLVVVGSLFLKKKKLLF